LDSIILHSCPVKNPTNQAAFCIVTVAKKKTLLKSAYDMGAIKKTTRSKIIEYEKAHENCHYYRIIYLSIFIQLDNNDL
jgi:hypothetical protein